MNLLVQTCLCTALEENAGLTDSVPKMGLKFRRCHGYNPQQSWKNKLSLVLLPGKSHGRRSLEGCSPWGRWGSDTTEQLHFHFSLSCIGEGNGNPTQVFLPGESQGRRSLVGCRLWGRTESDTTEVTKQQQAWVQINTNRKIKSFEGYSAEEVKLNKLQEETERCSE